MNQKAKEKVMNLLENYQRNQEQIALLHYELKHPAELSLEEEIDVMNFGRGDGIGHSEGHISNKTMYIALNFREKVAKENTDIITEISKKLVELEQERDRLHYYVSLLDKRQAEVIRLFYFKGHSWDEISQELGVALRTAHKIKAQAVERLVEMYSFMGALR